MKQHFKDEKVTCRSTCHYYILLIERESDPDSTAVREITSATLTQIERALLQSDPDIPAVTVLVRKSISTTLPQIERALIQP